MPPSTSIPRFLLPQGGAIWRARVTQTSNASAFIRNASNKPPNKGSKVPGKPLVLEKPTKFNPPSHGQQKRTEAPRYLGPQLSEEEKARQSTKKYPSMMPPPGSFMHWFLHNRAIHMYITMGTLLSMAGFVWSTNFKQNSPFADLLPTWGHFFLHPITSTRQFFDVVKMNMDHNTRITMEKRKRKSDDVLKRAEYRKAHGLDTYQGFGGWTLKSDPATSETGDAPGVAALPEGGAVEDADASIAEQPMVRQEKKPLKKWLGIW